MDRIAFTTLLMGLIVGTQPVRVEVSPDLHPAAIVYYLDGQTAGGATAPPWEANVDFGRELRPHEFTAAAMDASGNRIAAATRLVNLPAPASRVDVLIDRANGLASAARLVATSLRGQKPVRETLTLDGKPLALDAESRARLPKLDLAQTHVLSASAVFGEDTVARADVALGGGLADESGSRLTAVAIRLEGGASPTVESLTGRLRHGAEPLRVVAVDRGPATVVLVRDPNSGNAQHIVGRSTAGTGVRLDPDDRVGMVWPVAREARIGEQQARLMESTPYFTGRDGSLFWVLTRVSRSAVSRPPYLFADAVAAAGLQAFNTGNRRAVILADWLSFDASQFGPAQVAGYLHALGVPLHVWSFSASDSAWGKVEPVRSFVDYRQATEELRRDLDSQRIVWVIGEWQPGQIELTPAADGISLLR